MFGDKGRTWNGERTGKGGGAEAEENNGEGRGWQRNLGGGLGRQSREENSVWEKHDAKRSRREEGERQMCMHTWVAITPRQRDRHTGRL